MTPSPEWNELLEPFRPQFTQPGFRLFKAFIIVCSQIDRRLLVTHVALAGLVQCHYTCFYRFLKSGSWSVEGVGQVLASMVLERCWPHKQGGQITRVFAAVDDSVAAKYGKHFDALGIHHDPMNRANPKRLSSGHCFVCLALIGEQAKNHFVALFVRAALYVQKKSCNANQIFATKLELAVSLLQQVQTPAHILLIAVADGAYAKKAFVQGVIQSGRHIISRLRTDCVFYDQPEPPKVRQRGHPRKYGQKHKGKIWAAQSEGWREVSLVLYGRAATVKIKSHIALHRRFGGVLIRIVAVCWQSSKEFCEDPVFLFSTDTALTDEEIVRAYGSRFCIETGFRDSKQSFGFSTYQIRRRVGIERLIHLCLWSQTLVRLRFWHTKPLPVFGDWRKPLAYLTLPQQKQAAKLKDGILDNSVPIEPSAKKSKKMGIAI